MIATPEGIGSKKFSFLKENEKLKLMQGGSELAVLSERGESVKFLLVTSPQLWAAANEVLLQSASLNRMASEEHKVRAQALLNKAFLSLSEMVAKGVGKQKWDDVLQG